MINKIQIKIFYSHKSQLQANSIIHIYYLWIIIINI